MTTGIEQSQDSIATSVAELAQEAADRVVGGALKAARFFVPTRENSDGKKEHCKVSLHEGHLYVGTEHSICAAIVRLKFSEMCKKKGPLRAAMAAIEGSVCAELHYGTATPWLKTHKKSIAAAEVGRDGIRLVVASGLIELDLRPTQASTDYAYQVAGTIGERVLEDRQLTETVPLPDLPDGSCVLELAAASPPSVIARLSPGSGLIQIKIKGSMIADGSTRAVTAYSDPLGGVIVRFTTESDLLAAEQFFRVLEV